MARPEVIFNDIATLWIDWTKHGVLSGLPPVLKPRICGGEVGLDQGSTVHLGSLDELVGGESKEVEPEEKTQGICDLNIANGSVGVELILFAAELLAVGLGSFTVCKTSTLYNTVPQQAVQTDPERGRK